jgi:membrane-bound metal-dependent hydrolase YbcI (DUF457 family)
MTLGEHAMIGALCSWLGPYQRWGWRGTLVMTAAACVPDLDSAVLLFGSFGDFASLHRAMTHGILGLVVLNLLLALFWRWLFGLREFWRLFLWGMLAAATHVAADMITGFREPEHGLFVVRPFWPFWDWGWATELLKFADLIPLLLLAIPCFWIWRRPQHGRYVAPAFLSALVLYCVLRALLPAPTGVWAFITGGYIDPVYEWIATVVPGLFK